MPPSPVVAKPMASIDAPLARPVLPTTMGTVPDVPKANCADCWAALAAGATFTVQLALELTLKLSEKRIAPRETEAAAKSRAGARRLFLTLRIFLPIQKTSVRSGYRNITQD